jgi:hypothetical protein
MLRLRRRCVTGIRYAWAAPATLVGLVLSVAALVTGARPRVIDGAIEISGGRIDRVVARLPRRYRFVAITFGHVVICVDECAAAAARSHEQAHIRQYERFGLLFFPLYLVSSLAQWLRGRDPYLDNRFEREARGAAGD